MRHSPITLVTFLAIIFALGGDTMGQLLSNGLGQGEHVAQRCRLLSHTNCPSCRHHSFLGCRIRRPRTEYKPVVCLCYPTSNYPVLITFYSSLDKDHRPNQLFRNIFFSRCMYHRKALEIFAGRVQSRVRSRGRSWAYGRAYCLIWGITAIYLGNHYGSSTFQTRDIHATDDSITRRLRVLKT